MANSEYIIDVTETDFEYQVINYSSQVPVVVDFWAEWCGPCKVLGPMLERLAQEAHGAFRLAKIDIDANPNLAQHYNIRSIPSVKAFKDGQVVAEFTGSQPEGRVREFLRELTSAGINLELEKAQAMLHRKQWASAESEFLNVLDEDPDQPAALLGLAMSMLAQGKGSEAFDILRAFPASKEYAAAENLRPLAEAIVEFHEKNIYNDNPLEAAYNNSLRLVARGNIYAALDGLLDILRQEKHFRHDEARRVYVGLLELLGDEDPDTAQYRKDLAATLF